MEDLFVRRGYRYEDDGLEAMLARVGASLAPKPTDDYIHYRFHVLRDVEPNAFALPESIDSLFVTSAHFAEKWVGRQAATG